MKNKHLVIIVLVVVSTLFFLISLKQCDSPPPPPRGLEDVTSDSLTMKIEEMGSKPFDSDKYDSLSFEIIALSSGNEINSVTEENLNEILEDSKQKALAKTINRWKQSCYSNVNKDILRIATQCSNPINVLDKELNTYKSFKVAKYFSEDLNHFLNNEFSEEGASLLESKFKLISRPFLRCSEIKSLQLKISNEIKDFRDFVENYENIVRKKRNYDFYSIKKQGDGSIFLQKYEFYRKEHEQYEN